MDLAMARGFGAVGFTELNEQEMMWVDGGESMAGVVCGIATIIAGVGGVVGGILMLATPEPTGLTKAGGVVAICVGVATIVAGVAGIVWALED